MSNPETHHGACHCGAVKFTVDLDLSQGLSRCNGSFCRRRGALGAIVKPSAFHLVSGEPSLSEYAFNARVGHYRFCKVCGVHVYGHGTLDLLGGAFVSVNVDCIDDVDLSGVEVRYLDGRADTWQVLRTEIGARW